MEKEILTYDNQQILTYCRQGVRGETAVLPSMGTIQEAKQFVVDDRLHELRDFLKRPFDVSKFVWTTNQLVNSELIPGGIEFPNVLLTNPQFKEKVRGFLVMRGNLKVRILMNAQKFQQGKLLAYWVPNYSNLPTKAAMIQASLSGKSGCPHTKLSCENTTEQTIDIPYVNQNLYYNMATNEGTYGNLFLTPLLQLRSSTGDSVGLRIQVWMENPEIEFATSAVPVLSQAASQMEEASAHSDALSRPSTGGLDISSLAGIVKDVKLEPSYLARSFANAMELMGWQKPTQNAAINRTSLRTNSYMANYNGEHMAHKLSLAADNILASMDVPAGTNVDEMNINTICKIPTYYRKFSMKAVSSTAGDAENTLLFVDRVHPQKFTPETANVLNSTFLGYVSSCAAQWRGSIKYSFDVAKTGFHSGTVRVSFLPGVYSAIEGTIPNPTNNPELQLERAWQQTFDLRDRDEFSVVVPYANSKYFSAVVNPNSKAGDALQLSTFCTGIIVVDVFVPLVAPTSVDQTVDFAVWVSAGDDFMLANPTAPPIYPYSVVQSQSLTMTEPLNRQEEMFSNNSTMTGAKPDTSFRPSALCTGEVMASIKSLIGRFGPFYTPTGVSATDVYTIAPFDFQDPISSVSTVTFDYIDFFSYLYGFYRGGVRISLDPGLYDMRNFGNYRVFMRSSLNNAYPVGNVPRGEHVPITNLSSQMLQSPFATIMSKPSIEGLVDVEVPYYSFTHVTPALTSNHNRDGVEKAKFPLPIVTFVPRISGTFSTTIDPIFWRAADEAFRFMYLLGPPQVVMLDTDEDTIPEQFFDVVYPRSVVVNNGAQDFKGMFDLSSFVVDTVAPGTQLDPPSQFLVVNTANTVVTSLPRNVNYGFWSASNSLLNVNQTHWNMAINSFVWNGKGSTTALLSNLTPNLITKPTVITPVSTQAQAVPDPCISFTSEVCTVVLNTSITIPSQRAAPFLYGTPIALIEPLFARRSGLPTIIPAGGLVTFSDSADSSTYTLIVSYKGIPHALYTSLAAQTNFPTNVPSDAFTSTQEA